MQRKGYAVVAIALLLAGLLPAVGLVAPLPPPPLPVEVMEPVEEVHTFGYATTAENPAVANITRLQISPSHKHVRLQPGEEEEFTVNVKNMEDEAVNVRPQVVIPPYGEHFAEEDWITVTPSSAELPAKGKQKFKVNVKIPKDAETGYYSMQIAFTNDTFPTPYPEPYPNYVNTLHLSIDVWEPPKIEIMPTWIHDRIEAGKECTYEIKIKNKKDEPVAINPKIEGEEVYGRYKQVIPAEGWVTISAPAFVGANSEATVKVTVKVPSTAETGIYEGIINLNIDDDSIKEWDQRVHLNIEVWKQPSTPFTDTFEVHQGEDFSVEITVRQFEYRHYGRREPVEPSFSVTLVSPLGERIQPEASKTVKTAHVSVGKGFLPPWEEKSESIYRVTSMEYTEIYTVKNATAGIWTLEILPKDAEDIEYKITIGGEE